MHWFLKFIFGMKLYMFRTVPVSIVRGFFTIHTAMVYVIQVCWQFASRIMTKPYMFRTVSLSFITSSSLYTQQAVSKSVWHVCTLKKSDDGQRNCPKHVKFHSKNKFEKLVHLVDFIMRIYHDERPPERQIRMYLVFMYPLFLSDFNSTWISSRAFPKNTHTEFHENSRMGAELFLADRQI